MSQFTWWLTPSASNPERNKRVTVWYGQGLLYWSFGNRKVEDVGQSLQLSDITDIYMGKQSAQLTGSTAVADHCFTIVTNRGVQLDLEADTADVVTTWLEGISQLLGGEPVESKAPAAGAPPSAQSSLPGAPAGTTSAAATPVAATVTPAAVAAVSPPVLATPTAAPVVVAPVSPPAKQRPPPRQAAAASSPVASSPVVSPSVAAAPLAVVPVPVSVPAPVSRPLNPKVVILVEGRTFTWWTMGSNGNTDRKMVLIWYQQRSHALFWSFSASKVEDSRNSVSIASINDILMGKHTDVLNHASCVANDDHCFTIVTSNGIQLNLEAANEEVVTSWLEGVSELLAEDPLPTTATSVDVTMTTTNTSPPVIMTPVPSAQATPYASFSNSSNNAEILAAGRSFNWWIATAAGSVERKQILVWYKPIAGSPGTLYWSLSSNKLEDKRLSFDLADITDVYMGPQTAILKQTAGIAVAEHCFTIVTKRGLQLDLEANSGDTVTRWLEAVSQILASAPPPPPPTGSPTASPSSTAAAAATTANDTKIATAATSAPTPSPQATVALLTNGEIFAAYEQVRDGRVVRKAIFLYYRDGHDGIGLYWCEPGRHEQIIGQSLPFALLTDVLVGKLTPILKAPIAAESPENLCFSLLGTKTQLNLAATSSEQLRLWLAGISQLVSSAGQKVVLQQTTSDKRDERRYSIQAPVPSSSTSLLDTPSHRRIAAGLNVNLFDTQRAIPERRSAMHVFYRAAKTRASIGGMGTLYWCAIGRHDELPLQSLVLESITDIFIGKQHQAFALPITSDARAERCFSIIGDTNQLHCEASSTAEMNDFIMAFKTVLTSTGKEAVDTATSPNDDMKRRMSFRAPQADKSPVATLPTLPVTPSSPTTEPKRILPDAHTPAKAVDMIANGRHVTRWTDRGPQDIFLHWKSSSTGGRTGTLYWSDPTGPRENKVEQSLSLDDLTDIYIGKQTRVFQQPSSTRISNDVCFSLITPRQSLDIEEEAKEYVTIWLSAFNHVLHGGNKDVMLEGNSSSGSDPSADDRRMSILKKVPNMKTRASMTLPGNTLRRFIEDGRVMTIYENPDKPTKKKVFIYYKKDGSPAGGLYWCEPGQKDENGDQYLALHTITDILVGKQTRVLQTQAAASADDNRCLSFLCVDGSTLNLEAESNEQLNAFVTAVHHVLTNGGKNVVMEDASGTPITPSSASDAAVPSSPAPGRDKRRFSVQVAKKDGPLFAPQALPAQVGTSPVATLAMMRGGQRFNLYTGTTSAPVNVFYVPTSARMGALFWCDPGKVTEYADHRLPLHELHEVFIGKQTPAFLSASAAVADASKCFSLIGKKLTLNLEADTTEQLSAWLFGINTILGDGGRDVVMDGSAEDTAASSRDASRRYSILKKRGPMEEKSGQSSTPTNNSGGSTTSGGNNNNHNNTSAPEDELQSGLRILQFMEHGVKLFNYGTLSKPLQRIECDVYFKAGDRAGSLEIVPVNGNRVTDASIIQLHHVTDIYTGKTQPIWQVGIGARANENACVTIMTKDATWNFEATHPIR